ncbi:Hypothetical protein A7982_02089 [Minicystis rosea]|nr:Hypothetical protein A7982_02089 [Minicystis rosea]
MAGAVSQLGCVITARTFVDKFTFPDAPSEPPPAPQYDLTLGATVLPALVVGYHEPRAAAACLKDVMLGAGKAPVRERVTALWSFGSCMSAKTVEEKGAFSSCAAIHLTSLPHVSASAPAAGADAVTARARVSLECRLAEVDEGLLLAALGDAGQALFAYHRGLRPEQRSFGEAGDPGGVIHDAMTKSVEAAVSMLEHDPDRASESGPSRAELPTVAMSGGAASGAFTAGYLFAMLDLRERTIAARRQAGDAAAVERIRTRERFGAATGASVGALLATLLDLYFADASPLASAKLPEPTRKALEACIGAGPISGAGDRLPQACALALMEREFTARSEWHHLCVENADVLDLLGSKASSFMRFDPMRRRLIEPFFRQLDAVVGGNDFVREVTAVDLRQNVLMSLDERACSPLAGPARAACLENAVIASIAEPVFARHVDRVYSGLRGAQGEDGHWVDGGVRSGTPALRALQLTDWPTPRAPIAGSGGPFHPLRVLAINTSRAEGVPSGSIQGAFPALFGMIGAFVGQARQWEQAFVVPYAELRRQELCDLRPSVCDAPPKVAVSLPAPSLFTRAGLLSAVYVPEKVEPASAAADAYQFDPFMMLGLFLLGERTFVESDPRELLGDLGWITVRDQLDNQRLSAWKKDVAARVDAYRARAADASFMKRYRSLRKSHFDDCIRRCDQDLTVTAACDEDPLVAWDLARLRPASILACQ